MWGTKKKLKVSQSVYIQKLKIKSLSLTKERIVDTKNDHEIL